MGASGGIYDLRSEALGFRFKFAFLRCQKRVEARHVQKWQGLFGRGGALNCMIAGTIWQSHDPPNEPNSTDSECFGPQEHDFCNVAER